MERVNSFVRPHHIGVPMWVVFVIMPFIFIGFVFSFVFNSIKFFFESIWTFIEFGIEIFRLILMLLGIGKWYE